MFHAGKFLWSTHRAFDNPMTQKENGKLIVAFGHLVAVLVECNTTAVGE